MWRQRQRTRFFLKESSEKELQNDFFMFTHLHTVQKKMEAAKLSLLLGTNLVVRISNWHIFHFGGKQTGNESDANKARAQCRPTTNDKKVVDVFL